MVEQEFVADVEDEVLLLGCEVGGEHAFVGHNAIVAEGAAAMALIVWAPGVGDEFVGLALVIVGIAVDLLHAFVPQFLVNLRFLLLRWLEALHQVQAEVAFFVQDFGALPLACIDDVGLCSGE